MHARWQRMLHSMPALGLPTPHPTHTTPPRPAAPMPSCGMHPSWPSCASPPRANWSWVGRHCWPARPLASPFVAWTLLSSCIGWPAALGPRPCCPRPAELAVEPQLALACSNPRPGDMLSPLSWPRSQVPAQKPP